MNDVADVLLNVEHAISRAQRSLKRMGDSPAEHNARLALESALTSLKATRKRLERDTYYDGGSLRLV
jgi:hypothetical protein